MIAAAKVGAAGATGAAAEEIAAVAAGNAAQAAVAANDASVKGIAKGMKGIVEAAGKLGVELTADAAAGVANAAAGNLFAGDGNANGTIVHVGNAADAVSKVSGKQILKAIVDSAEENGAGAQPAAATSPIAAAIGAGGNGGAAGDFAAGGNMNRDDNIAAAIVKFAHAADAGNAGIKKGMKIAVESAVSKISELIKEMIAAARVGAAGATGAAGDEIAAVAAAGDAQAAAGGVEASVKGIAKGMKGIVEAAGKLGVELAAGGAAAGTTNGAAGNLFAGDGNAGTIANVGKAADAVSKVSGKQILKAIVDSAEENGAQPANAGSPIAAAIGDAGNGGAAAPFGAANGNMNRDDNIAAAIVLRGMAASGKFAHGADNDGDTGIKKGMKIAVESVDAAGAQPANAGSPIAAAIGDAGNGGAAGAFAADNGNMNRDDKIAAAIVLRGMAASGKFAHAADAAGATGITKGMKIDDCCC
ncbi:variable large family protein [Borreliella lusitaniae]|uniref:variable large family protein n=1 Tax=Borreliella lusitaniae TaxID=100177 RepID=UPI003C76F421